MPARITIERILRDADDDSGQSVRNWTIESEAGHVTIRMKHGNGFIMMGPDDIDQFVIDLKRAKAASLELFAEQGE